jgi:hypothetical protein
MVYNGIDGSVLLVTQKFFDDEGNPVLARAGYPQVRLVDVDKQLLSSVTASPTVVPGEWTANVSIPNMSLLSKTELRVNWRIITSDSTKITHSDAVLVEPKVDTRVSDVVGIFGDQRVSFTLPMYFGAGDTGSFQIYGNNVPILDNPMDLMSTRVQRTTSIDKTVFMIPFTVPQAQLSAYLLKTDIIPKSVAQPRTYTYKMWAVTPQIMLAMTFLEDFLNKSRVEQVIPELQFTPGDLVSYLERGLYLFNTVGNTPSWFNGTNMQGILFDAWVTCSCYYALGAQLMAEGSLAFDFSGQGISLNVDRTPQLEAALGRIESAINDRIVPLKKQLAKQGVLSGDGSVGSGSINNPSNIGTLSMLNAVTTRIRGGRGGGFGLISRW